MRKPNEIIRRTAKHQERSHSSKGTTLLEILIVILLSVVIMLAFLSLFSSGQKYFINQDAKADTIEDSRYPIAWITRDIKEAVQVVPGPITIGGNSYSTSQSCLVLQVPSVDGDGVIIDIDNDFDYIVYRLNTELQNRLERIVDGKDGVSSRSDRTRLLADNVDSFALSFLDAGGNPVSVYSDSAVIDISLSSVITGVGRTLQDEANTRAKLRNKPSEG